MTSAVRAFPLRLADGRELLYFDGDPPRLAREHQRQDRRHLPPTATSSELRHDPLVDEWVTVASHRQGRTYLPADDQCPLCPSTETRATEIPAYDYDVAVFENRFPSLTADPKLEGHDVWGIAAAGTEDCDTQRTDGPAGPAIQGPPLAEPFAWRPGRGRCEVVCFTPVHESSFAQLRPEQARTVLEAWIHRARALAEMPDVAYVYIFENCGLEIGVTLGHPHGQIYAFPFVPPRATRMGAVAGRHLRATGRCLGCDVVSAEAAEQRRVVAGSDHWLAFVPFAARWPFEVHLSPRRHVSGLPELDDEQRDDFVALYLDVLRRFDALFDQRIPYISAWYPAPVNDPGTACHLSLEVFSVRRAPDKLKFLAGVESGQGAFINDIAPERAAALLRDRG